MKVHYYYISDEIHGRPIAEIRSSGVKGLKEEFHPAKMSSTYPYTFIDILLEDESDDIETNQEALSLKELLDVPHDIIEEIISDQRPRADSYSDLYLILFKCFTLNQELPKLILTEHQVGMIIRNNVMIAIHHAIPILPIEKVFKRFNKYPLKLAKGGLTFFVCTFLDIMIDQIYDVLEAWTRSISRHEVAVIKEPEESVLFDIIKMRHRLLDLVKILQADREVVNSLKISNLFSPADIPPELDDHIRHLLDEADIIRDLLTQLMNVYYSSDSAILNITMKRFTFITSLILVPSLIAGIFGMNFFNGEFWQMLIVIGIMILIVSAMWLYFKRKKYI